MIVDPGNPFEPPSETDLDLSVEEGTAEVSSVSFRVSLDDLRRANARGLSPLIAIGLSIPVVFSGSILIGVPGLIAEGNSNAVLRLLMFAVVPVLLLAGILSLIFGVRNARTVSAEAPFETTVTLTPSALVIREAEIAELRRSWSSVSALSHDRHQIRFEFVLFDVSKGRFVAQPGQIVPIRAFESDAEAASFIEMARRLISGAAQTGSPE